MTAARMNRMVGSFGPYCIFQTGDGFFVRLESLSADPRNPARPKRSYRTINALPVATKWDAEQIISDCLFSLTTAGKAQTNVRTPQ